MGTETEGGGLNEILDEFLTEADEGLDALEQDLIKLEALASDSAGGDADAETVDRIFRLLHTLKGGAGFLGLERIAKLAHAGENLVDEVRNARVVISKAVMDALLQTTDMLRHLLAMQRARQEDGDVDDEDLREILAQLAGDDVVAAEVPAVAAAEKPLNLVEEVMNSAAAVEAEADEAGDEPVEVQVMPEPDVEPAAVAPAARVPQPPEEVMGVPGVKPAPEDKPVEVMPVAQIAGVAPAMPREAMEQRKAVDRRHRGEDRRRQSRRGEEGGTDTLRVETRRLDKVLKVLDELMAARDMLQQQLHTPAAVQVMQELGNAGTISAIMEQLSRAMQSLQVSVLSTRMQAIGTVFEKLPRQVRELKTALGKDVNLIVEGDTTEVDQRLLEELGEPVAQMVRNALEHGLELPDEREKLGKPREGTLAVRAFHEGGNVVIQVQEDGRGIEPEKIRRVAVKKGLVSADMAKGMSDAEVIRLIMAPGFSTAEVSEASGHGMGMDVVNTKISALQGSIDIRSEAGVGTCFSLYLPLPLAIVNALIVGADTEGFAIPITDIAEVVAFRGEGIHRVNNTDVIELHGEALPLYYLSGLTQAPEAVKQAKPDNAFVVVVREEGSAMGLVVDALLGQEEVVMKPAGEMFAHNRAISGATVMADGKVRMVLDVPCLMKDLSGGSRATA